MKILTFGASNHKNSINKSLAFYAATLFSQEIDKNTEIEFLDLNDYEMPIYSIDREQADGIHPLAQKFFDKITASDALILSFPAYNGTYSSAYKNIFDWASRIDSKVYQGKPALLLSTSPGPGGADSALKQVEQSAPFFGLDVKAALSVGSFNNVFDSKNNQITEESVKTELLKGLNALQN